MTKIIEQKFYLRDGLEVARDLLGKVLVREIEGKVARFRIVETEAYLGPEDKGHTLMEENVHQEPCLFLKMGGLPMFILFMECITALTL